MLVTEQLAGMHDDPQTHLLPLRRGEVMAHKPLDQVGDQGVEQAVLWDIRAKQHQDTVAFVLYLVLAGGEFKAPDRVVQQQVEALAKTAADEIGSRRPTVALDVDEEDAAV